MKPTIDNLKQISFRFLLNCNQLVLFLFLLMLVGCSKSGGVTFKVNEAKADHSGNITLSLEGTSAGGYEISTYIRTTDSDSPSGKTGGIDSFPYSTSTSGSHVVLTTSDPNSVYFYMKKGDSFFVASGSEKKLLSYSQDSKQGDIEKASYIIKVKEAKNLSENHRKSSCD